MRKLLGAAAVAVALLPGVASAQSPDQRARSAADWLLTQQQPDGGFFAPDQPADAVLETAAAVAAGGGLGPAVDRAWVRASSTIGSRLTDSGWIGRALLGTIGIARDPRNVGGTDLIEELDRKFDGVTGRWDSRGYANALATLAHRASGRPVPEAALRYWRVEQCSDGGFSNEIGCRGGADTDTTSLVAMALQPEPLAKDAVRWLQDNGGETWRHKPADAKPNANSTGLAVSALAEHGKPVTINGLARFQLPSGGFVFSDGGRENGYATVQAIPGVRKIGYPVMPAPPTPRTNESTEPNGSMRQPSAASPSPSPDAAVSESVSPTGTAGVVVSFPNNRLETRCLDVTDTTTGKAALEATGLAVVSAQFNFGPAVCSVDGTGCTSSDCLDCEPGIFWSYWYLEDGSWVSASTGANARTIGAGGVDGWVRGDGSKPPPEITLADICGPGRTPAAVASKPSTPVRKSAGNSKVGVAITLALLGSASALWIRRRRAA